jgi:hypothetical protein
MDIKNKYIRDFLSVVIGAGYLFFPDNATAKVQQYPTTIRVMRTSWEKSTNPYLYALTFFDRGYLETRKNITIDRPPIPSPTSFANIQLGPIEARLYFPGSITEMSKATKLIFNVHGGGFVAMNPKHHDEYFSNWSRNLGVPLVSINYKKAPEYPFPFAIEECFDAYRSIVETNGAAIGLEGWVGTDENGKRFKKGSIKIVFSGDSAYEFTNSRGANIIVSTMIKILEYPKPIRHPAAILLVYPCLNFDLGAWQVLI